MVQGRFIDKGISFKFIMDNSNSDEVFQYYTIINDSNENSDEKEDTSNQVVYFTVDDTCDVGGPSTDTLEACDTNTQESDSLPSLDSYSNVQIITLDDGRVFMTTTSEADENFESIEPHLITSSTSEPENETEEEGLPLNLNEENEGCADGKYEIVQVLDNSSQKMFEMVYCNPTPPKPSTKKEKTYVCLYEGCGKTYAMSHQLDVHMRTHLCFKPYACTEEGCDKTFSTNYSLKAHIRTHTGEKPYTCSVCEKAFKTSGDLQKHVRIHTGEKPFMCPVEYCGKSFTTSNIRKVHVRSHTGERPYTCNYPNCGKAFSSSTNYKNHVRIHSGEKPYVCQVKDCGKRFTEYSSLYKHNMVHQTDRPFTCRFCGQKFKQQSAMSLHKRVKHNIIIASDGTEIVVDIN